MKEHTDLVDTDIAEAIAEIEIDLEESTEVQQSMKTSKEYISELSKQLEAAKQASDAAQAELDSLQLREAKAIAELEVTSTEKERIEEEIANLTPTVEKLQEEVKQVKADLQEATAKLNEIKETKEQEQFAAERARHALQATVSLEAKLIAETDSAKKNAERYSRQTQEIRSRLDSLNDKLDEAKEFAKNGEEELRSARVAEARRENELSLHQKQNLEEFVSSDTRDYELSPQSHIQAEADSSIVSGEAKQVDVESGEAEVDEGNEKPSVQYGKSRNQDKILGYEQEDEDDSENISTIYNLYDAGYSVDDISKATNIAQGQVELFIKMRTFKRSV